MKEQLSKLTNLKHEFVLMSLLAVLFGPLLMSTEVSILLEPLLFALTIFAGYILYHENRILRPLFFIFFIIVLTLYATSFFGLAEHLRFVSRGIYLICFMAISYETYMQVYLAKEVNRAMLIAVFTGYILLCLISGLYFVLVETISPGSFSNIGTESERYNNLSYFSFMTTLTIGFGDIVPLTMHAKKATILAGLLGNFYTVIVTGIIIGKYLNRKS